MLFRKIMRCILWTFILLAILVSSQITITPELEKIHQRTEDDDIVVRKMAFDLLSQMQGNDALYLLARGLNDTDERIVDNVLKHLNSKSPELVWRVLKGRYISHDSRDRYIVATLGGYYHFSDAMHVLYLLANDTSITVARKSIFGLVAKGEAAYPYLRLLLQKSPCNDVHNLILSALQQSSCTSFWRYIPTELATNANPKIRQQICALQGIWKVKENQDSVMLHANLQDISPEVRATAVWVVGELLEERLFDELCRASLEENWMVRCASVASLGKFSEHPSLAETAGKKIVSCLQDHNENVRTVACRQIGKFPQSWAVAYAIIQRLVVNPDEKEVVQIAGWEFLGQCGAQDILDDMPKVWLSANQRINSKVCQAIENALFVYAHRRLSHVLSMLHNPQQSYVWKTRIILVLGRLYEYCKTNPLPQDGQEVLLILPKMLENILDIPFSGELELAELQTRALQLYTDLMFQKALTYIQKSLSHPNIHVKQIAILALGRIQSVEHLPILFDQIFDTDARIRESALQSIATFPKEIVQTHLIPRLPLLKTEQDMTSFLRIIITFQIVESIPFLLEIYHNHSSLRSQVIDVLRNIFPNIPNNHAHFSIIQEIISQHP